MKMPGEKWFREELKISNFAWGELTLDDTVEWVKVKFEPPESKECSFPIYSRRSFYLIAMTGDKAKFKNYFLKTTKVMLFTIHSFSFFPTFTLG